MPTSSTRGSQNAWENVLENKKEELAVLYQTLERRQSKHEASRRRTMLTLDEALKVKNFGAFEASVQRLCTNFADQNASQAFSKYLYPHFDHLRSFGSAFASISQTNSGASLCWGLFLIVIQCGCVFTESMEDVLQQTQELEKLMPDFEIDMSLYPDNQSLQFSLQDLVEDYVEYCFIIVRHFTRGPMWVFFRSVVSSSLRRELKARKERMSTHITRFNEAAARAARKHNSQVDRQLLQSSLQPTSTLTETVSGPSFPVDTVNIAENTDFYGRDDELKTLYTLLVEQHNIAKPFSCALRGIGGVGKSQTALKFTYQYRKSFEAVFWVSADPDKETEIRRTFGAIGRTLRLFNAEGVEQAHIEQILHWLQHTNRRWLLVFDNVGDWKHVAPFWPVSSSAPGAIIVTTQGPGSWTDHQIPLEPLDGVAGSEMFLAQLQLVNLEKNDPKRKAAEEISTHLGGLPLYLTYAQGFLSLTGATLDDYLEILRAPGHVLDNNIWDNTNWRYGRGPSATHDHILKKLSKDARSLLFLLTFLNPDDIGEDLLLTNHTCDELGFLDDKKQYLSHVAELRQGRLIDRDTGTSRTFLTIHRATQVAMLERLDTDRAARRDALRRVVLLLRDTFPRPSSLWIANVSVWPRIQAVLPHVQTALRAFEPEGLPVADAYAFAELLTDVGGMDLYDHGLVDEAYRLSRRALEILDGQGVAWDDPLRGDALTTIGLCTDFMDIGKRMEGRNDRELCLRIRKECHDKILPQKITVPDRIRLHNSYTDLACSMQQYNDFDRVQELCDICHEEYQLWGSEQEYPYEYSKYYNLMSYVFLYRNESQKAVEFAKKGYELVEQAEPGTDMVQLNKFDWVNILFQHGDMIGARREHVEILKEREKYCGKENVRTLQSKLNLAIVNYFLAGAARTHSTDHAGSIQDNGTVKMQEPDYLKDAETQLQEILKVDSERLWPRQNVARAQYYLSLVIRIRDAQSKAADELEQQAKTTLEELLAKDHTGKASAYHGNFPLLFDYIVQWECRLVTPREEKISRSI